MTTTIITSTYNKAKYLGRAGQSIFDQTDPDWIWWLILDGADQPTETVAVNLANSNPKVKLFYEPTTEEERKRVYRPAVIINQYYPLVETEYIAWLSDDDFLEPCFLEVLTNAIESNPGTEVAFGHCKVVNSKNELWGWRKEETDIGFGTNINPCCRIDGCQILHTKKAYDSCNINLHTGWVEAGAIDGVFMKGLATKYTFKNVHVHVMTHCCTELSHWSKG